MADVHVGGLWTVIAAGVDVRTSSNRTPHTERKQPHTASEGERYTHRTIQKHEMSTQQLHLTRVNSEHVLVVFLSQDFAHNVDSQGTRQTDHAVRDLDPQVNLLLVCWVVNVTVEADLLLHAVESAGNAVESLAECHCEH